MKDFKNTYCNPIKIEGYPKGEGPDHRSLADPSVIYHEGAWYMYPSYNMAYVTKDFASWERHDIGVDLGYAPTVAKIGDKFYIYGRTAKIYESPSPLGPFTDIGNFEFDDGTPLQSAEIDPMIFTDDDGLVYIYYSKSEIYEDGIKRLAIYGVRLDEKNPKRVIGTPVRMIGFDKTHTWECFGERNQNSIFGYIEGVWMYKRGSRYYLTYSGSGTAFGSYATGAYYSDEGPLSGFVYQNKNPICNRPYGLVSGGGHGCIVDGPDGNPWAFYTIPVGYMHRFERMVGMDPVMIDENGEISVITNTDYPRFSPGVKENPVEEGDTGLLPLSYNQVATASSNGRNALYAIDENIKSYWMPEGDDQEPTLTVYLTDAYDVSAVRIIWRDIGLDYDKGIVPEAKKYSVELSPDGKEWHTALDMTKNEKDYLIDYNTFDTYKCKYARLKVKKPLKTEFGVIDFSVFGVKA